MKIILKFKFSVTIQSFIGEMDLSIYMFFFFGGGGGAGGLRFVMPPMGPGQSPDGGQGPKVEAP